MKPGIYLVDDSALDTEHSPVGIHLEECHAGDWYTMGGLSYPSAPRGKIVAGPFTMDEIKERLMK